MSFRKLYEAGFRELVSVIPPNAELSPTSKIAAEQAGKAPGRQNFQGTWGGYDWRSYAPTPADMERWDRSRANIGLKAGKYPAVDIDVVNEKLAKVIGDMALKALGHAPTRIGRKPKRLLMYRTNDTIGRMQVRFKDAAGVEQLVELLGEGQQYVIGGVHPLTKEPYTVDVDLAAQGPAALTEIGKAQVEAFFADLVETLEMLGCAIIHADQTADRIVERSNVDQVTLIGPSVNDVAEAVAHIPNTSEHFPDRDDYIRMGYAIKAACGPEHETDAFEIFWAWADKWEDGANSYEMAEADFGRMHPPYELGWEWIEDKARSFGYRPGVTEFEAVEAAEDFGVVAAAGEGPIEYSDIALAQRLLRRHVSDIRYVAGGIGWVAWDGNRWARDFRKRHINYARQICSQASGEALAKVNPSSKAERVAARVATTNVIYNVAKLAETLPEMQISVDQLDADIYMLNTPAGIVDLRTGEVSPHDRSRLCTKVTLVAPDFDKPATRWHAFLNEACNGDEDLKAYLQRLSGYALTGSIKEHVLAFAHGDGGNGKGTWLNAIGAIMADYAAVASADVFLASQNQRHPTELAALMGARLVRAQEIDPSRKWDEAKVKSLTGGDVITARFMRGDFFEYEPQFTLIIAGNTKPEITNVDDAMRRRMHLIPFETKPAKKDTDLPDKLKEEYPSILAWMIEGAVKWYAEGLNPPAAVLAATEEYLASEDVLSRWIAERCVVGAGSEMASAEAFLDFQDWCKAENESRGRNWSQKKFSTELRAKGFEAGKDKTRTKRVIKGIELLIGHEDQMVIDAMTPDDGVSMFFGINFGEGDE